MINTMYWYVIFTELNVYSCQVIIDEVDTMLLQGFGSDVRAILRSVPSAARDSTSDLPGNGRVQIVMATATLTKPVLQY